MMKKYAEYNYWANLQLTNFILKIENEKLNTEIISSFSSIRKTVYHIWDAEVIWLERLLKSTVSAWPPSQIFDNETKIDILLNSSKNLLELIQDKPDSFFQGFTTYSDSKGNSLTTLNDEILHHVFNHSTFHRGQLVTMLRQLGYNQIPQTDFIAFVRL
jgi:uncharacterized damage-inducible protein DinB